MPDKQPVDEISEQLRAIRAKRGYLLPHHGLMAVTDPQLLSAYDATYTALTLAERELSRHDHETVWLAIFIATDEALATHHIPKFLDAGGSVPYFVEAAAVWRQLILDGRVSPSAAFRTWAEIAGQGGFDEAQSDRQP